MLWKKIVKPLRIATKEISALLIILVVAVFAASISASGLTLDQLFALNPSLEEYERGNIRGTQRYEVLSRDTHPVSFLIDAETGKVVMIQAKVFGAWGWQPWYDQPDNEPQQMMVYGPVYSQQVFLAEPVGEMERIPLRHISYLGRGAMIRFEEQTHLDFESLEELNSKLHHYETIHYPDSGDANTVLHMPGGTGMSFLADLSGEVFAVVFLLSEEAGWMDWADQEQGLPLEHPDFGGFYSQAFLLREPGFDFDIDKWYPKIERERVVGEVPYEHHVSGDIEPGFIYDKLEFEPMPYVPMAMILGKMTNDTGKDYLAVTFRVLLLNEQGERVGEGAFGFHDFRHGQTQDINGMAELDVEVDLDTLSYEIEIDFMY
jgi:hypothetical protein